MTKYKINFEEITGGVFQIKNEILKGAKISYLIKINYLT